MAWQHAHCATENVVTVQQVLHTEKLHWPAGESALAVGQHARRGKGPAAAARSLILNRRRAVWVRLVPIEVAWQVRRHVIICVQSSIKISKWFKEKDGKVKEVSNEAIGRWTKNP